MIDVLEEADADVAACIERDYRLAQEVAAWPDDV